MATDIFYNCDDYYLCNLKYCIVEQDYPTDERILFVLDWTYVNKKFYEVRDVTKSIYLSYIRYLNFEVEDYFNSVCIDFTKKLLKIKEENGG